MQYPLKFLKRCVLSLSQSKIHFSDWSSWDHWRSTEPVTTLVGSWRHHTAAEWSQEIVIYCDISTMVYTNLQIKVCVSHYQRCEWNQRTGRCVSTPPYYAPSENQWRKWIVAWKGGVIVECNHIFAELWRDIVAICLFVIWLQQKKNIHDCLKILRAKSS